MLPEVVKNSAYLGTLYYDIMLVFMTNLSNYFNSHSHGILVLTVQTYFNFAIEICTMLNSESRNIIFVESFLFGGTPKIHQIE